LIKRMERNNIIEIAYGRSQLPIRLPSNIEPTVIRKLSLPKIDDPALAVRNALLEPIGKPSLSQAVQ